MFGSTLIWCARASGLASPTLVPSRTEPCRDAPPPRASKPSSRLVLPLWNGPTIAISRGPAILWSPVALSGMALLRLAGPPFVFLADRDDACVAPKLRAAQARRACIFYGYATVAGDGLAAYRRSAGGGATGAVNRNAGQLALGQSDPLVAALDGRSIVLVGMMGAGKTAVGRRIAQRLRLPFVDADAEIEAGARMTIPEIFERFGEPISATASAR